MASADVGLSKFDTNSHGFSDFCDTFADEYEVIAKDPPNQWNCGVKRAWFQQNKRKGIFCITKDFEEVVTVDEPHRNI